MDKPSVEKVEFLMPQLAYNINIGIDFRDTYQKITPQREIEIHREKFLKAIPYQLEQSFREQHPDAHEQGIKSAIDFALSSMEVMLDDSRLFKPIEIWTAYLTTLESKQEFSSLDAFSNFLRANNFMLVDGFGVPNNSIRSMETGELVGRFTHKFFISSTCTLFTRYKQGISFKYWISKVDKPFSGE